MQIQTSRRTAAAKIFDQLHADIVSLRLLPGTKLSESEIARLNGVSRQPVREAFIQLSNKGLLKVRPQKATQVRKISVRGILNARFIRTAVEIEVIRSACSNASENEFELFVDNLNAQKNAALKNDATAFHMLDYDFHRLICVAAESEFAYATIAVNKAQVDRLCMLCLTNRKSMLELVDDHSQIYDALQHRDVSNMTDLTRMHLSRTDITLKTAREENSEFFED